MDTYDLQIKSAEGQLSVLQLTDPHLFAEESGTLLGVHTAQSFKAVLESILNQNLHFDCVIVSGDISQDYSVSSYQRFAHAVSVLERPVFFVPGNHDDGPLMYRILSDYGVNTQRCLIADKWQFVFLNSEVYSVPHGWVERHELNYLRDRIEERPDLNTVVVVHHLPRHVNSRWLDTQTMHNQDEFNSFICNFPQVKLVLSGHVHQEYDQIFNNIRYIASPSTSIQFEPYSHDFALDLKGPGWRYLQFDWSGNINTQVFRLPEGRFIPDTSFTGY
ncbi:3',5'-cyclic-AMP phosphodiesterase [Anaerobiospirillum succiniciproducens]|uniref:3',5'-cyclic-AMP phosphodiesterase n=1 Tax=Anaerobiospirillum succiniciproducens TaxID=13335 RepID=UPI00248D8D7F|nr:3',5'-cyclic-AMP phosphodiesterase [Anaerobiospirillum succiniciproducens]